MKQNLTRSESIKTFVNVSRHVELDAERIEFVRISEQVFVAIGSVGATKSKKIKWFKKGKGKVKESCYCC